MVHKEILYDSSQTYNDDMLQILTKFESSFHRIHSTANHNTEEGFYVTNAALQSVSTLYNVEELTRFLQALPIKCDADLGDLISENLSVLYLKKCEEDKMKEKSKNAKNLISS